MQDSILGRSENRRRVNDREVDRYMHWTHLDTRTPSTRPRDPMWRRAALRPIAARRVSMMAVLPSTMHLATAESDCSMSEPNDEGRSSLLSGVTARV